MIYAVIYSLLALIEKKNFFQQTAGNKQSVYYILKCFSEQVKLIQTASHSLYTKIKTKTHI